MKLVHFDFCSILSWDIFLKVETDNNHWKPNPESKVDDEVVRIVDYQ